MEQPSITYSSIQFVDHDSTHGISSHEDDNCQEKLSEDGQKRQEKLSKSSSYFKQPSQEVTQQSQRSQRKCSLNQRDYKQTLKINSSSYFNRELHMRRNHRKIRRQVKIPSLLNLIRQSSSQNTNNSFAAQIFNGSNFH